MENRWTWRKVVLLLLALSFLGLGYAVREVFVVVFAALVLAYLLEPMVKFVEKHRFSRSAAIGLVYLLWAAMIGGIIFWAVPRLSEQIGQLEELIPAYFLQIQTWLEQLEQRATRFQLPEEVRQLMIQSTAGLKDTFVGIISRWVTSLLMLCSHLLDFFLVPVLCFYLLRDKDFLLEQASKVLPIPWQANLEMMWREINHLLKNYLLGNLSVSIIVAAIVTVGLKIIGMDFALVCGLLVGALNIIPYFGAILGAIPAVLIGLLTSVSQAAAVIVVMIIAQQLESNMITPRIVGEKIGVHPIAVLLGVLIWGKLFGIWGILLAVPATGVVKILLHYLLDQLIPPQPRQK